MELSTSAPSITRKSRYRKVVRSNSCIPEESTSEAREIRQVMIDKKKGKLVCDETRAAKGKKLWVDERWFCVTKGFPVEW
jgi:hypothetical protein